MPRSVLLAAATFLLAACPGCLTERAVILVNERPVHAPTEGGLWAIARIPTGGPEVQLAATDNTCRATILGDGSPEPATGWFQRVPESRVAPGAPVTAPGERVVRAYAPEGESEPTVVLLAVDRRASFAIRGSDGTWSRHAVSTFDERSPPRSQPGRLRRIAGVPLIALAFLGDVVIAASVVGIVGVALFFGGVEIPF